jgi:hypothetical protein
LENKYDNIYMLTNKLLNLSWCITNILSETTYNF